MINRINTIIISIIGIIELSILCYAFSNQYTSIDHAEHLHASWLVWQQKIPYLDFFEHHNPLLWYILSPIVALFNGKPEILYVSRVISLTSYMATIWVLYKISTQYLKFTKIAFLLGVLVYFSVPISYYLIYEMHPDIFMIMAYFIGLYYYFSYLEDKKTKYLAISFLFFTISFLFLQKILVVLFFTSIFILYHVYTKKIDIKSFIKALIVPLSILLLFVLWLYSNDALEIYIQYNYTLNYWMQKINGSGKFCGEKGYTLYLPLLSIFALKTYLKDKNQYKVMLCSIMYLDYLSKYFTGSIHIQYFIFNNLISSIIIGYFISKQIKHKRFLLIIVLLSLLSVKLFNQTPINKRYKIYYQTAKEVIENVNSNDYFVNSINYINIYNKDVSYYWFGYGNMAPLAHYMFNHKKFFSPDFYIQSYRPKYVYYEMYYNAIMGNSKHNGNKNYEKELEELYPIFPIHKESKEDFVKRWSQKEFYIYNGEYIKNNYYKTDKFPLIIKRDYAHSKL